MSLAQALNEINSLGFLQIGWLMYLPDLARYPASDMNGDEADLVAVGWLDASKEFPTGLVKRSVREKILQLCVLYRVAVTRGVYPCNIPPCDRLPYYPFLSMEFEGREVVIGSAEIRVMAADQKRIYAAPNLIAHYIEVHGYLPPEEFQQAVQMLP